MKQSPGGENSRTAEHLTGDDISRWLVEGPAQDAEDHLQSCSACRAALAEAQGPFAAFRSALVSWSEAQSTPDRSRERLAATKEQHFGARPWLPVMGFALALLLIGFARISGYPRASTTAPQATVSSQGAESDAALLSQVDVEVSEAVPDAMAPLTDLVAWESSAGATAAPMPEEKAVRGKASLTNSKRAVRAK